MSLEREGVLDAWRHLGEAGSLDNLGFLKSLEALGERLGTDAGEGPLQFAEPSAAVREVPHDKRRPLVANDLRGAGHRAAYALRRLGDSGRTSASARQRHPCACHPPRLPPHVGSTVDHNCQKDSTGSTARHGGVGDHPIISPHDQP